MTVGGVFRGPAAARFRSGLGPAQAEVIHRPENSAGLRARFDSESLGIFGFRCRPALPGSSSSPTVAKFSLLPGDVGSICAPGPRPAPLSPISIRFRSSGSSALADILVQCPRTGAPVPTGLKTEWVLLKSLPCVAVPLRCPACGQMHKWRPDDAWIGSVRPAGDGNFVPASRTPLVMASGNGGAKLPDCD